MKLLGRGVGTENQRVVKIELARSGTEAERKCLFIDTDDRKKIN